MLYTSCLETHFRGVPFDYTLMHIKNYGNMKHFLQVLCCAERMPKRMIMYQNTIILFETATQHE